MKKKYFNLRISDRRLNKLRSYAVKMDKTMTQVIEECIDRLPDTELGDSDARSHDWVSPWERTRRQLRYQAPHSLVELQSTMVGGAFVAAPKFISH